jgi:hypothetical protein
MDENPPFVVLINAVSELAVLKVLHRKSVAAQSLEEFKASLLKVQD